MSRLNKPKKADGDSPTTSCSSSCLANIANLLEEHSASISADHKKNLAVIEEQLSKIQTTINDHGQRIVSLESAASTQDQRIQALEDRCAALAESNRKLIAKMSDLEGRSRRNNIRIVGLPECIEGPRPTKFFSELLVELLGNQVLQSHPELDHAHRSLAAKPQPGSRPRPVIIWLHHYQTKDLIIRGACKKRGSLQYQGTRVQIFKDFRPEVMDQCSKYWDIMAKLYNLGLRPALLFPARLHITLESGVRRWFATVEDAAAFAADYQPATGNG